MDPTGAMAPAATGGLPAWLPIAVAVAAVALGVIVGIAAGKYQVRRARSGRLNVLTKKEKIIYGSCVLAGIICIALGVFVKLPAKEEAAPDGISVGDEAATNGEGPSAEGETGTATADAGGSSGGVAIDTGDIAVAIPG